MRSTCGEDETQRRHTTASFAVLFDPAAPSNAHVETPASTRRPPPPPAAGESDECDAVDRSSAEERGQTPIPFMSPDSCTVDIRRNGLVKCIIRVEEGVHGLHVSSIDRSHSVQAPILVLSWWRSRFGGRFGLRRHFVLRSGNASIGATPRRQSGGGGSGDDCQGLRLHVGPSGLGRPRCFVLQPPQASVPCHLLTEFSFQTLMFPSSNLHVHFMTTSLQCPLNFQLHSHRSVEGGHVGRTTPSPSLPSPGIVAGRLTVPSR
jgi:hypothetical protein